MVLERAEGLLVNSVVKNFGKVEVDEIREIPEEYEIKKKKQVKSVGNIFGLFRNQHR